MYCPHCGKELKGEQAFCAYCGAKLPKPGQNQETRKDPSSAYQKQQSVQPAVKSVGFLDAILCFYKNYANFKGRATRKEYWYIVLYMLLISIGFYGLKVAAEMIAFAYGSWIYVDFVTVFNVICMIVNIVPGISLAFRRLHDTGKSGVYYLFILIPVVGSILLIVFFCTDSDADNQYGPRKTEANSASGKG